jgi:hypothetical protein
MWRESVEVNAENLEEFDRDHPPIELPASIKRRPLSVRSLQLIARSHRSSLARHVAQACVDSAAACNAIEASKSWNLQHPSVDDLGYELPVLLISIEERDRICAAEMQAERAAGLAGAREKVLHPRSVPRDDAGQTPFAGEAQDLGQDSFVPDLKKQFKGMTAFRFGLSSVTYFSQQPAQRIGNICRWSSFSTLFINRTSSLIKSPRKVPFMLIHDEGNYPVGPEDEAVHLKRQWETAVETQVPMKVELHYGKHWK